MFTARFCTLIFVAALSIMPSLSLANTTDSYWLPTGVYRVQTKQAPSPIIVIEDGTIVRSYGQLSDEGCITRHQDTVKQNVDLEQLFSEVKLEKENNTGIYKQTWRSNQPNGKSPFASSTVSVAYNNEAGLQLTHTVSTFLVSPSHIGGTLCNRHHKYLAKRIN